jgi:putative transposase
MRNTPTNFETYSYRWAFYGVRLPPRAPNLNPFAERFVRSLKEECLNRMIFFGHASLRLAITQYMTHYHDERNHRGLENRLLRPFRAVGESQARVKRCQRLGRMLSYFISKQLDQL